MPTIFNADCNRWPWPYPLIPTIPQMYMDAVSVEQQIKDLYCWLNSLSLYTSELDYDTQIQALQEEFTALYEEYEKFKDSGYEEYYEGLLTNWINENAEALITQMVKMVFFGLTDDGYFVAYIPDSWEDITFYTEVDTESENYGKLQLIY